jgi:hypothetical protein
VLLAPRALLLKKKAPRATAPTFARFSQLKT